MTWRTNGSVSRYKTGSCHGERCWTRRFFLSLICCVSAGVRADDADLLRRAYTHGPAERQEALREFLEDADH